MVKTKHYVPHIWIRTLPLGANLIAQYELPLVLLALFATFLIDRNIFTIFLIDQDIFVNFANILALILIFLPFSFVYKHYISKPILKKYTRVKLIAPDSTLEQWHEFDNEFFSTYNSKGYYYRNKWSNLNRVDKATTNYTIFLNQVSYIRLPFDAFESDLDRQQFEAILRSHNLLKIAD